jgi:hypothetical protein
MVSKKIYCNHVALIYPYTFSINGHTMVCKKLFIVDHIYMQCKALNSLKTEPVVGCMTCLYTCLYDRFEMLRDGTSSVGCTCPKS